MRAVIKLPTHTATRYVQPLREGGSLPAIVDTHDGGLFVAKFRGAGQGAKALIAELIVGLLAREAGLPVPELALIEVADTFGRSEPDPEIQDLLRASYGTNIGLRYLDGAFNYDGTAAGDLVSTDLAARIIWLDAFVTNPDRTHRNPNLLVWQRKPWLIDHGAALYAQHDWPSVSEERTRSAFPLIERHVLLRLSGEMGAADQTMSTHITAQLIRDIITAIPESLIDDPAITSEFASTTVARERYVSYLTTRLESPRAFVHEAEEARVRVTRMVPQRMAARR
ncbi:MAG TPA: HipA family kinase [Gemmatimonadaceae bacterium]|nr:HipA family kinase [Gemmatimonadaceae bacterium]